MTAVKICGITNLKDARAAARAGADILGFVFANSPRRISPQKAKEIISKLPKKLKKAGVFVNETPCTVNGVLEYCGIDIAQLHGDESPAYCRKINAKVIKAFRPRSAADIRKIGRYCVDAVLIDAHVKGKLGGTGKRADWKLASLAGKYGMPVILSGGLTPDNLEEAIGSVGPHGVDICSGTEVRPGKKDVRMIRKAVAIAKSKSISQVRRKKK